VSSFVVKMPQISFASSFLGLQEGLGRYHFSSSAFELQMANPALDIDLDLSLLCSDSFYPANPVGELHACDLLDFEGSKAVFDNLLSGRVDVVLDSASSKNFFSELVGTSHTFSAETVDIEVVEAKVQSLLDKDASSSSSPAAAGRPARHSPLQPRLWPWRVAATRVHGTPQSPSSIKTPPSLCAMHSIRT
jgi:hypothetical protein